MSLAEPVLPLVDDRTSEEERLARLRLARSRSVGPRTYAHLLRRFGSGTRAIDALPDLPPRGGREGFVACSVAEAQAELDAGAAAGARMLLIGEPDYPPLLAALDSAPPVIWMMGEAELFARPAIAIVGARNASALGLRSARRLAAELGERGQVVVSGLARGIDTAAHQAALPTGTIAVLAGGIDRPYPAENADLARQIAETGVLISECPPGIEPTARHFPRRNRLISGLAAGVLLIEAAARSGSLITARFALEQGREAMACPGAPEDPRSAGCNAMIRDGAALIRSADDVLEALAMTRVPGLCEEGREFGFDVDDFGDDAARDDYDALSDFDEEEGLGTEALADQILELLTSHPIEIDEIARACGVPAGELSLAILELDLAGRVDLLPGGMIARAGQG